MGFEWSTFLLEALNFLILIWILGHFFYRPVAAVIERRRLAIETRLRQAQEMQVRAEAMQSQYETRLSDWESEKRQRREVWLGELAAEKARQTEALRQTLEEERQRAEVLEQRRRRSREAELEQAAVRLAARFAARLLERLSNPELEARLIGLFIEELADVPPEQWELAAGSSATSGEAILSSAFPLAETQRTDLQQALSARLGIPVDCRFQEDPMLIAGIRFELGPLSLGANIRDELSFFNRAD